MLWVSYYNNIHYTVYTCTFNYYVVLFTCTVCGRGFIKLNFVGSKTWSHRSSSSLPQQQLHSIQQSSLLQEGAEEEEGFRFRSCSMNIPSLEFSNTESELFPDIITEGPTPRRFFYTYSTSKKKLRNTSLL